MLDRVQEKKLLGLDLVQETKNAVKIIWDHLRVPLDRRKSYSNLKRKDIEFSVGDQVILKVLP